MDCEKFDTVTMELLYGELDELSEAAALRHLHHCTRCRDIWGHFRTTRELSEIPLEEAPADLFENIMAQEAQAKKTLPLRERASRVISIMAEYAMRPQLAMAALLMLMIGSSLVFVRTDPQNGGHVSVTELGTPHGEGTLRSDARQETMVFEGNPGAAPQGEEKLAATDSAKGTGYPADNDRNVPAGSLGKQTYSEAMSAYQEGRYAEAERLFSEVASSGDERAASAALHEGHAARNGSGCQRAAALYDSVAARYTGGTVADEASWHAASCYRAMGQLKRAAAHYTLLRERAAYSTRAQKALEEIEAQLSVAAKESTPSQGPADAEAQPAAASPGTAASSGTAADTEKSAGENVGQPTPGGTPKSE
jgi:TolA-binding protein